MQPNEGHDTSAAGLPSRGEFLAGVGAAMLTALVAGRCPAAEPAAPAHRWKGRGDSKVKRWAVVTIGNLSRNHYWGEGDEKGVRGAICTCTLVAGDDFRLLVDPSLPDAEQMAKELDRRTGLKPKDITAAFVTHEHRDHWAGLAHFPGAKWLAGPAVAEILNKGGKLPKRVEGVTGRLFDAVDVVPTPGHTKGHHSARFDCDGFSVVAAGDAIATKDFFRDRRSYFNAVDFEQSARTMDAIAAMADLIVPGHDNYFLSDR